MPSFSQIVNHHRVPSSFSCSSSESKSSFILKQKRDIWVIRQEREHSHMSTWFYNVHRHTPRAWKTTLLAGDDEEGETFEIKRFDHSRQDKKNVHFWTVILLCREFFLLKTHLGLLKAAARYTYKKIRHHFGALCDWLLKIILHA